MASNSKPFEWLGLLRWSLAYTDGTRDNSDVAPMSAENRAFLEEVMTHGILDEGERMKTILSSLTQYLEEIEKFSGDHQKNPAKDEEMNDLIIELRDIVGLIDCAKMFAAMGGIKFLIGAASEKSIPRILRSSCMTVLATLCQNNPSVQLSMLEQGNIPVLIHIYSSEYPVSEEEFDGSFRSRVIQAISATVRGHELAENVFCMNEHARGVIEKGLGMDEPSPLILRKKTLFFLRALITSDYATHVRLISFAACVEHVVKNFLDPVVEANMEIREMALSLINRVIEQKISVDTVLKMREYILELSTARIESLRQDEMRDADFDKEELNLWETLIDLVTHSDDELFQRHMSSTVIHGLLESSPANKNSAEQIPQ